VFVLTDLDLGMNSWMTEPFPYPEKPIERGKVLNAEDLDRLGGFSRYKDVDADGIGYRTLPGTKHPAAAYFTRGSGHNEKAQYTEREDDYRNNMDRLARKFETMRKYVPQPMVETGRAAGAFNSRPAQATIGLIYIGSSGYAVRESSDQLWKEYHIAADCLRVRAYPFTDELKAFIQNYERVYVVEQNRDAQLLALMRLEFEPDLIARLRSVRYYGGLPLDARTVTGEVVRQEMG
jgi:2-oxoglutarate/2-oxoacid ferredoxin oxidoreductase subunit alpha